MRRIKSFGKNAVVIATALAYSAHSWAQATQPAPALKSTADKVLAGEPVLIGVRGSSSPLSFKHGDTYAGLAVDLCLASFNTFVQALPGQPKATYKLVEVTSANRIDKLLAGEIDMECGSTTNTAKRRNQVEFSTPYYFANIKALKLAGNSKLKTIDDLPQGSTIIYTKGTTTEQAIANVSLRFKFRNQQKDFKTVLGSDHQDSFNKLTKGDGLIFANDDILLMSLVQKSGNPSNYKFLDGTFSIEPYAIMTRKSDELLTTSIRKTINEKMLNGEFKELYNKWFLSPIPPNNITLNIPMSTNLRDVVRFPTEITGN